MSRPLHVEVIAKIEWQVYILSHQFIHNAAVVNTLDRNQLAVLSVKQPPALLDHVANIYDGDAELLLRDQEIGERLLLEGIDFQQHRVFSVAIGHDHIPHELPVGTLVEVAEKD